MSKIHNRVTQSEFAYHSPSARRGMMTNSDTPEDEHSLEEDDLTQLREFVRAQIEQLSKAHD